MRHPEYPRGRLDSTASLLCRLSSPHALVCNMVDEIERAKNRIKSKVRVKVEHPSHVIKRVFGFAKVC